MSARVSNTIYRVAKKRDGWYVTGRYLFDGYPSTFVLAGPYRTKAQAQKVTDERSARRRKDPYAAA